MVQPQVIQGSGEELAVFLQRLRNRQNLLLIIPAEEAATSNEAQTEAGQLLRFGMFPQLRGLSEEDFKSAEWHEDEAELA